MLLKSLLSEELTKKKTLFKNEWISMMSVPEKSGAPYIYSHETRCNGNIVAVLLYNKDDNTVKYGVRSEKTPCWGDTEQLSSLTGGVDKGSNPTETAVNELKEEAGLIVKKEDLEPLGTCRGTKSCDTTYHLFALDVSGLEMTEPTGEDTGDIVWLRKNDAIQRVVCPLFYVMIARLGLDNL
jgi:8-oxo-dGTP pyrophosphatase MutT (NUDIX family)